MILYLLGFFLIVCLNSIQYFKGETNYKKIVHNFDPEAKCLDGTPGLLYVHQGGDPKKFLIFFQGGGLCGESTLSKTLQSCYQRSKTILGSSKFWPEQFTGPGYLSSDPNVSKFSTWTKFIFGYCDGSLHQGWSNPIKYKDTQLYFRGSAITRSHFNWIDSKYDLKGAQKIILTGASAGGIGVNIWNNYVRTFVRNPDSVYSIADSGVFMNFKTHLGASKIQSFMQNLYKVANTQESTPVTQCNLINKGNEWRCIFIQNTYTTIKGKFLIINSEYDAWAIPNILDLGCLKVGISGATLSHCTKTELTYIEKYRSLYRQTLAKFLAINSQASIWSIACSNHVYACIDQFYDSPLQKIPTLVGKTVKQVIQQFVLQEKRVVSYDLQGWPSNTACAN